VPPQAGRTHDEIIRNLLKPTQGQVERRSINGLPATLFAGQVRSSQGQVQNVRLTVVTGPAERHYLLQPAARDAAALQRAAAGLAEAEATFRAMDRAAARPWVIRSAAFPRGGWEELARSSPLGSGAVAQLRLLNGVYDGGAQPRVGDAVKVVQ
jgi:predicted Zn-dependent protease